MRQVSLREFRTRGARVLESVPAGETILLAGQDGPAYFLVPVEGDVANIDRELRRAMAKVSLRESWRRAQSAGLHTANDDEIDEAVAGARRRTRKSR